MIKTERGTTEIKGELYETLADYGVITVAVREVLEETIGKERAEEEMQKNNAIIANERRRKR